jgi:glutamate-1-semialdehyde 2,1-aminomutase
MKKNKKSYKKNQSFIKSLLSYIPGGAHTYSKSASQFSSNVPALIKYGKGATVYDLFNKSYLDSSMGLSSVSLGHAYRPVIKVINKQLDLGVNFSRPSVIELDVAKKFLNLIPQHQMIKFAKNGSTVTTAAIKLARAFTGRDLVLFPDNHPFYSYDDWFIGKTNINLGVPKNISKLSITFKGCNLDSLKKALKKYSHRVACVITEPLKNYCGYNCGCINSPRSFLEQAIDITHHYKSIFILDEMVTGFKFAFPGAITKYNLDADLATWGKSVGNGFSFCALTGKRNIMSLGDLNNKKKVFLISTTHGAETHSLAAGSKVIDIFIKKKVIKHNYKICQLIIKKCSNLIKEKNLGDYILITECPWLVGFEFCDNKKNISKIYKTLFIQEMIKNGVLFQGTFVSSLSHSNKDVKKFINAFENALNIYQKALKKGATYFLNGGIIKPIFNK